MLELRLIDPNGYTVPTGVRTVPASEAEVTVKELLTEVAADDMAEWGFGRPEYHRAAYRVQTTALAS